MSTEKHINAPLRLCVCVFRMCPGLKNPFLLMQEVYLREFILISHFEPNTTQLNL